MNNNPQNSEILSENEKISIKEMIENALINTQKYTVDFDFLWKSIGYSRKDSAKRVLEREFRNHKDYEVFHKFSTVFTLNNKDGRPVENIKLTLDCAINFAKKSNTVKSNSVYDFMVFCKENFKENNQKIVQNEINEQTPIINLHKKNNKYLVFARDLYDFLEISERFNKWIERMFEYGFEAPKDYTPYQKAHPHNNQIIDDYILTLDTAKEIAMIQRTPKGKQAREYFINCEKELLQLITNTTKTSQDITIQNQIDTLKSTFEQKFDDLFNLINQNYFDIMQKNETIMFDLWGKSNDRILLLEQEVLTLKNEKTQNKVPKQKKVFVFLITLHSEKGYHKIFMKENPIFIENNKKIYFEQTEVLFSIQFETKKQCKELEKSILNILKMQNTHIYENFFQLKPAHFQMLKMLEVS